jgi:hypothetical protein
MSYDIHQYSDEQCFEVLGLNNPSDRELEMKILQQMDKYEEKSKRLYRFFEQMYDRFFDGESEAEEEEEEVEGFTTRVENGRTVVVTDQNENTQQTRAGGSAQISDALPSDVAATGSVSVKKIDDAVVAAAKTTDTRLVDYVKDPLKLNPTSQKTIFKMISIDSQYREDSQNTSATNFALNLSESLSNVISMKLYSVQIPYTWYTINNNFGSNYFYLKGNSPGIDNGQHDVKVQISSGTYTPPQIASALNTSIGTLKLKNTTNPQYNNIYDLSFGQTYISYNTANSQSSKILFEFDLKKTFNETDYSLYFPNWSTPNVVGAAKSNSIPSFLGYNSNTYLPYIAYSDASENYFVSGSAFTPSSDVNNAFQIIQYSSSAAYSENNADRAVHETVTIAVGATSYTRETLIAAVNAAMLSLVKLDAVYSFFRKVTVSDPANINNGKTRIELAAKLNRAQTQQIEGAKIAIVFPDETTIGESAKIWTGTSSCFRFPNRFVELDNIISETATSITNYVIPASTNIILRCVLPGYDISYNYFKTTLTPGTYTLNNYTSQINTALDTGFKDLSNNTPITDGAVNPSGTSFYFDAESYPTFSFDISRNFPEQNYIVDLTGCILSKENSNFFNFDNSFSSAPYSQVRDIDATQSLSINSSNKTIVLRAKNSANGFNNNAGNYNAADITIELTERNVSGSNAIANFCALVTEDFTNSGIMKGSILSAVGLRITLTLKVNKTLTEKDYAVFYEGSTWTNNFGLSLSPSFYSLLSVSDISGTKSVFNNLITVSRTNNNNQIIFRPVNPALIGGNDILFEVPPATYTRDNLISEINILLGNNAVTVGSTIRTDVNNISTLQMRINKKYTSADFRLVFYDIFSFVYCNVGVSNVRNVKWDTTLGWTLGFHTYTEYNLSEFSGLGSGIISSNFFNEEYQNYYSNIYGRITAVDSPSEPGDVTNTGGIVAQATYTNSQSASDGRIAIIGDSVCNTNLYNYFLLVIDDFIQNHVNDGLITIASVENDIALPSYASNVSYQCDPITGRRVAGTVGTNNQFTNLTAKQLYSMNQILDARRSSSTYTAGPYMRDVFGLIPIKLAGLSFGSTYMEFGGTLQNQNRKYFGPVNIKKMSIKLMNDRGDVVDLNGTNWSFTLICEILNTSSQS